MPPFDRAAVALAHAQRTTGMFFPAVESEAGRNMLVVLGATANLKVRLYEKRAA